MPPYPSDLVYRRAPHVCEDPPGTPPPQPHSPFLILQLPPSSPRQDTRNVWTVPLCRCFSSQLDWRCPRPGTGAYASDITPDAWAWAHLPSKGPVAWLHLLHRHRGHRERTHLRARSNECCRRSSRSSGENEARGAGRGACEQRSHRDGDSKAIFTALEGPSWFQNVKTLHGMRNTENCSRSVVDLGFHLTSIPRKRHVWE